ncbi:MAG: MCE family protein [Deltaproteobacteria bacterium]|jgi:phospholipid/cholesterol/gamma-HCH transport system substrate-binding protein|nr:MCE family protein [Deltaproteobacteria bacterium]
MYSFKTELKVGLFILLAIGALVWMTFRLGGFQRSAQDYYRVEAIFPEAAGLKVGVTVQVAGISVGRVDSIELFEDQAKVAMLVRNEVPLPVDTVAQIKTQGMLGDKYVELAPGKDTRNYLSSGEQIERTIESPDMSELFQKLSGVADDLKVLTSALAADDGGQDLKDIVLNLKELSQNVNDIVKTSGPGVEDTLATLNRSVQNLESITDKLSSGQGTLGRLINDDSVLREFHATLASLREIADKVASGEGTLGRLVNDEETIDKIDDVLASVNEYMSKESNTHISMDFRADYMTAYRYAKGTANIRIHTSPDRYYVLGVTGDYFGRYSRTDYKSGNNTWQRENYERDRLKINAQIAQRFYDVVVRAGVFESGVGFGLDWEAVEHLMLTFEAFSGDFDHNPHLRAQAMYNFWKFMYLGGGYDDFISDQGRRSPYVSFGFFFTDDELKYLLGTATSLVD